MAQSMAQPRETVFSLQSPHSSPGGADSCKHEGTPDTRLTAFSPDENSTRSTKILNPSTLYQSEPPPVRFPAGFGNGYDTGPTSVTKDPFTSPTTAGTSERKLSATASTFSPFTNPLVARGSLAAIPAPNAPSALVIHQNIPPTAQKLSSDTGVSRYIVVTSTIQSVFPADVEVFLMTLGHSGYTYHGEHKVYGHLGRVYVQFTDLRDSLMFHDNGHQGGMGWHVDYIAADVCHAVDPRFPDNAAHEGVVFLEGLIGPSLVQPVAHVGLALYNLLQAEADIYAFLPQDIPSQGHKFHALVEFCNVEASLAITNRFNNFTADGIKLSVTACKQAKEPGVSQALQSATAFQSVSHPFQGITGVHGTPQLQNANTITTNSPGIHAQPQVPMISMMYQNPFPPVPHFAVDRLPVRHSSMVSLNSPLPALGPMYQPRTHSGLVPLHGNFLGAGLARNFGRPDSRRQNAMRVHRSSNYHGSGHHNHVDVTRIREGIDVRTTIMLRNIPNKVDQVMLKRIVDESSWGKYDFMYLRIDFANDCNVGYAFINFVDPLDIIDFVNARGNQRWNCFKSDKVAEISYATIQGKDCLVQKFRNSSVMLEAPHYRPKLYFTSNGPAPELAGQEESFPEPDNPSKMKRSCENAEHVGLFTPNAGQHFRDEQRRRRSQYDRGTRLAALEEFDYSASFQNLYLGQ